jgi:hypothetical protein
MADDYYVELARKRAAEIEADKAEMLGGLARAKAENNEFSGTELIQGIANCEQELRNLNQLHADYMSAKNPPQPVPLSREEWRARPVERMSADDGLLVARNSKYGSNLDWNDPNVQAGYQEMQRRRGRGE